MNARERKQAIAEARARVEKIAHAHIRIGARRDSTETERLRAETASIMLYIAEKGARLLPAAECRKWKKGLLQLFKKHERLIASATKSQLAIGNEDFTRGPVREAIDASLAAVELRTEEMNCWTDMHALNAWLAASDKFATWDKPLGALMKAEDDAREH